MDRVTLPALSIKEPYVSLILRGWTRRGVHKRKTCETRSWNTNHRGKLVIVTSRAIDDAGMVANFQKLGGIMFPLGRAVGIVNVTECHKMDVEDEDAACVEWRQGLYAWSVEVVRIFTSDEQFNVTGKLRLFNVSVPEGLTIPRIKKSLIK